MILDHFHGYYRQNLPSKWYLPQIVEFKWKKNKFYFKLIFLEAEEIAIPSLNDKK